MKVVGYAIGGIVAVVIVAVIVVFFFSGNVIKAAVEEIGPKLTQAEVKLDSVDLSITSGEAALSGLLIGNPSGFTTPHAFKLDNIKVKLDTGSIGSDTIIINEVLIDAPSVIAEIKNLSVNPLKMSASVQESLKTSNFIAIQNNVNSFIKAQGGDSGGEAKPAGESKPGPKLIIEKFRMNNVQVRAVAHEGLKLDTSIPPFSISLNDIGKKEGGLEPEKIAAVLIPEIQDAVINGMMPELMKTVTDMVGKMGDAAKDAVKGVMDGAGSVGEGASDAVKGVTEGVGGAVKGLFGK